MESEYILISAVLIPICGSLILPIIGQISKPVRNILAFLLVAASFVASATLIPQLYNDGIVTTQLTFFGTLTADRLAVFMALVSSFISAIIVFYSFDYISHYDNQNEYYFMVVLFLGSMMGICYASNLILLFIFWEITAFTSWRLIGFYRDTEYVIRANKAFMITVFGALIMLVGFIMIYEQAGSFDLAAIHGKIEIAPVTTIAGLLILAGILSKSATFPFHTWLPDAGVAPSPVTALLHAAVLVKIGVYVFARLFIATFNIDLTLNTIVMIIAAASMLISAGAALRDNDIKRIIAYSTISQIAFIFLGLASGTSLGIAGGLLYILMHGISKAGLFLCAGIIEQNTKTKDITKLGGLINTMPVTGVSFLLCSFSVMGIPPFGGFFSKYMVIAGAVNSGNYAIAAVFAAGGFLTILYLFRAFNAIFFSKPKGAVVYENSRMMVASVALLAILSLVSGLLVNFPLEFLQDTVKLFTGIIQ